MVKKPSTRTAAPASLNGASPRFVNRYNGAQRLTLPLSGVEVWVRRPDPAEIIMAGISVNRLQRLAQYLSGLQRTDPDTDGQELTPEESASLIRAINVAATMALIRPRVVAREEDLTGADTVLVADLPMTDKIALFGWMMGGDQAAAAAAMFQGAGGESPDLGPPPDSDDVRPTAIDPDGLAAG